MRLCGLDSLALILAVCSAANAKLQNLAILITLHYLKASTPGYLTCSISMPVCWVQTSLGLAG